MALMVTVLRMIRRSPRSRTAQLAPVFLVGLAIWLGECVRESMRRGGVAAVDNLIGRFPVLQTVRDAIATKGGIGGGEVVAGVVAEIGPVGSVVVSPSADGVHIERVEFSNEEEGRLGQ